jgi:hypothetical protein
MATKGQTVAVLEALDELGADASYEQVLPWVSAHRQLRLTRATFDAVMGVVKRRLEEATAPPPEGPTPTRSSEPAVSAPAEEFQNQFREAVTAARTLLKVCGGRRAAVEVINLVADAQGESP